MVWERGPKRRDWPQAFAVDRKIGVPKGEPHHAAVRSYVVRVHTSEQRLCVVYFLSQGRLLRRRREGRQRGTVLPVAPHLR